MKVLSVFGTRPEAIKMASVVKELNARTAEIESEVCISGQHREMLQHVLELFHIEPQYDLAVRRQTPGLSELVSGVMRGLDSVLNKSRPDIVLVHGDTSTTMAAALAAFHRRIAIGHVEAGLRTGDLSAPWPEEGNRKVVGTLATLHFAPTKSAALNLQNEHVPAAQVSVTGNTVIDTLRLATEKLRECESARQDFDAYYHFLKRGRKLILVTAHRRESFGEGFERICAALREIALRHPDVDIVYPVHLNPNVKEPVYKHLKGITNVYLIAPQDYFAFVYLMERSDLILTDSGGIQEEAPSLGKPVLVLRETTERPEAIDAGTVLLVGTDIARIVSETTHLLLDDEARRTMGLRHNHYGDGHAATRIVDALLHWKQANPLEPFHGTDQQSRNDDDNSNKS